MPDVLRIFHNQTMQEIALSDFPHFSIGGPGSDAVIEHVSFVRDHAMLYRQKNQWRVKANGQVLQGRTPVSDQEIKDGDIYILDQASRAFFTFFSREEDDLITYPLDERKSFSIGRNAQNNIAIHNQRVSGKHCRIKKDSENWILEDAGSTNGTYVNGMLEKKKALTSGDVISIERYDLVFQGDNLLLSGMKKDVRIGAQSESPAKIERKEYPFFKRSPRFKYEIPAQEITIQTPPAIGSKPELNWLTILLPPLAMVAVSAAVVFMFKTSMAMLYYTAPMLLIGVMVSLLNYSMQKKKHKKSEAGRLEAYNDHLIQISKELEESARKQMKALLTVHPETGSCMGIVSSLERQLWGRASHDDDFLTLRIGSGATDASVKVKTPYQTITIEKDSLLGKAYEIAERYKTLSNMPVTLDLMRSCTAGIIGSRKSGVTLVKNLIVQAAAHHCYTELKIITLFPKNENREWDFVKWLPHSFNDNRSARFIADSRLGASSMSQYFEELIGQRVRETQEDTYRKSGVKLPYFLFVVGSPEYMEELSFSKYLTGSSPQLGIGAVFLFDEIGLIPKDCNLIVEVKGEKGIVFHKDNVSQKTKFTIDAFPENGYDRFARDMAPVRVRESTEELSLPSGVTFLEGYGVKHPSEIDIAYLWKQSATHQTMSVPIGVKSNREAFYFDIHEKQHGPHGLVAGMTGSGKSEMIQSWILSMALHHPPQHVSFVLIDFKGTGLILPFLHLPHLAGTISDLDTNISRNLVALENELSRRKALLDQYGVNNINSYIRLYHEGKAPEPLSFLFIIIDEFAEFKVQFPDFMTVVDRIFAVGRTLGVFTILLTQKPGGVVGDKMMANTRFRWCLKVASSADSKEMLRHADAARITTPGRAYVQVGEDEIFELVQSYWSGAPYHPNKQDHRAQIQTAIALVSLNGKRRSLTDGPDDAQSKAKITEIDEIISCLSTHTEQSQTKTAKKIWMPKLSGKLCLTDIFDEWFDGADWPGEENGLRPVVGMLDDPRSQSQYPLTFNLSEDGHIAVYGAPGTGKTTLLKTLVMSLTLRYAPERVNIYIMDFGGWGMGIFSDFPHVGGVANDNDAERVEKTARLITKELETRKKKFASYGIGNIGAYREASGETLPDIVLILDNFAPVLSLYPSLEPFFIGLTREGGNYGVYFVTSANTTMALGYRIGQNIKTGIALQMTEASDYSSIVGRTNGLVPEKNAGRGLFKGYVPMEFQAALPITGENESEQVKNIRAVSETMNAAWSGKRAKPIPIMPKVIAFGSVEAAHTALGLSSQDVQLVEFDFAAQHYLIVSGRPASGKANMLKLIARQFPARKIVFDLSASLKSMENDCEYITKAEDFDVFIASMVPVLQERKNQYAEHADAAFEPVLIVIDDLKQCFDAISDETAKRLYAIVHLGKGLKVNILTAGDSKEITKLYNQGESFTVSLVNAQTSVLLGGNFKSHDAFRADMPYSEQDVTLGEYEGYLLHKEKALRFKAMCAN